MKHEEVLLTPKEKLHQHRKIEAFFGEHYYTLVKIAQSKLNRYQITDVEGEELVSQLYPIIDRLAFVHEGWLGEEDVLKQSVTRINGFALDELEKSQRTTYIDDQPDGFLDSYAYENYGVEDSAEESLIKSEIIQGAYSVVGDDPYRLALIGIWRGDLKVNDVAEEWCKHKSTVSHDKADLMRKIRDYMVKEGLV